MHGLFSLWEATEDEGHKHAVPRELRSHHPEIMRRPTPSQKSKSGSLDARTVINKSVAGAILAILG